MSKRITEEDDCEINFAIYLKNQKRYEDSLEILHKFAYKYRYDPKVYGLIAGNYFLMRQYEDARFFFEKTTALSPKAAIQRFGL